MTWRRSSTCTDNACVEVHVRCGRSQPQPVHPTVTFG